METTSKKGLDALPSEVLVLVIAHLGLVHISNLKQASRRWHYFISSSAYIWQDLARRFPLPLNLDPARSITSCSGATLEHILIRARRLENNWSRRVPHVHKYAMAISGLSAGVYIEDLKLSPGGAWLVIRQRNRRLGKMSSTFSLAYVEDLNDMYVVSLVEVPGICRNFAVDFALRGDEGNEYVQAVVSVSIEDDDISRLLPFKLSTNRYGKGHCKPSYINPAVSVDSIPQPINTRGIFHRVSIQGNIVAATITTTDQQYLFLRNLLTGWQPVFVLSPTMPTTRWNLHTYLTTHYLLVVNVEPHSQAVLLWKYRLCDICQQSSAISVAQPNMAGSSYSSNSSTTMHARNIYRMSVPDCETMHLGLSHSNSRATLVIFDTSVLHCATFDLDESQSGTFTLPLPLSGQTAVRRFESRASMLLSDSVEVQDLPKHTLTQSFATSFTLQDIGSVRGVWSELNLEQQKTRLMKLRWAPSIGAKALEVSPYRSSNASRMNAPRGSLGSTQSSTQYVDSNTIDRDEPLQWSPIVEELLPSVPNIPVRPENVRAIAFDEVSGRLCLGLWSGDIMVLDYTPPDTDTSAQ